VGVKTATLVLLFCFRKPVIPVDTHVHRVSQRVGLIGAKVNHEAAHKRLLTLLPSDAYTLYNFHVSMLKHGQKLCVWGRPRCAPCPLKHLCDWYQANSVLPD
jgi:endonuclease-3